MDSFFEKLKLTLGEFVSPIYAADESRYPEVIGTATLVKINGYYFLVTAAHVISRYRDRQPCLAVPSSPESVKKIPNNLDQVELLPLLGKTKSSTEGDDSDLIDFCIIELTPDDYTTIRRGKQFYDLRNRTGPIQEPFYENFAFTGTPETKNRIPVKDKKLIKIPIPNIYTIIVPHVAKNDRLYDRGYNMREHLVFEFQKKKFYNEEGERTISPDPSGISGGGVWHLETGTPNIRDTSGFSLQGIAIEWDLPSGRLIAVSMEALFCDLREYWPQAVNS